MQQLTLYNFQYNEQSATKNIMFAKFMQLVWLDSELAD